MAKQYQPQAPFTVPFRILKAVKVFNRGIYGFTYEEQSEVYYCSAKAYVGASKYINDLAVEETTLTVDSYFIPELKKDDRIILLDDNSIWTVAITPENINRRGQFMRFKVVAVNG